MSLASLTRRVRVAWSSAKGHPVLAGMARRRAKRASGAGGRRFGRSAPSIGGRNDPPVRERKAARVGQEGLGSPCSVLGTAVSWEEARSRQSVSAAEILAPSPQVVKLGKRRTGGGGFVRCCSGGVG